MLLARAKNFLAAIAVLSMALGSDGAAQGRQPGVSLAAPKDVAATAGDTIATLTWLPVAGAEGYRVFSSDAEGATPTLVASVMDTALIAVGLDNGTTYRFQVAAYTGAEQGTPSSFVAVVPVMAVVERAASEAVATPDPVTPLGPQNLMAGVPVAQAPPTLQTAAPVQMASPITSTVAPVAMGTPPVEVAAARVEVAATPSAAAPPAIVEAPAPPAVVQIAPAPAASETSGNVAMVVATAPAGLVAEPVSVANDDVTTVAAPAAMAVPATTALTARAGNAVVTLTWTPIAGATSYRIFRTTSGPFSSTPLTTTTVASYTNSGLTNGTTYTYTVVVRDSTGDSPAAPPASATPVAPPATPTGLITASGNRQVTVAWNAVTGAVTYNVYRGTVTGTQTLLTSGAGAPPFVDASVENGPSYFYKVTAVNNGGESTRSAEAVANPTGPAAGLDAATAAVHRFLRQTTWGPRPGDVSAVRTLGIEGFIDAQLAAAPSGYPDTLLTQSTDAVQNHFINLALTGDDQLRQRVAWALHKIWVVSGVEVNNSGALVNYHRALLNNAFGNYRELMEQVTLTPAMGRYLNMLNNRSAHLTGAPANENYARELMQLFTLGIPTLRPDGLPYRADGGGEIPVYSETDVKELARILTGWTFGDGNPATVPTRAGGENYRVAMEPVAAYHDIREKNFLGMSFSPGQSARADLEQALDLIFSHPNLGPFVSRQLIQQLVTSNPSPGYVWSVAAVFDDNGSGVRGDLAAVVKAIVSHPLAAQDVSDPGKLSEPVLFAVGQLRALGAVVTNPRFIIDGASNMGQRVLFPPSVFSYFSPGFRVRNALGGDGRPLAGPEFQSLTTVTAQTRVNFVGGLLGGFYGTALTIDYAPFTSRANDPAVLVDYCSELFLGTRMPLDLRNEIISAVRVTAANLPLERVRTAIYLTLTAALQQVE